MKKYFFLFVFLFLPFALAGCDEKLGLPLPLNQDQVYEYTGFTLEYSESDEQARWVAYELTAEEVAGDYPRMYK